MAKPAIPPGRVFDATNLMDKFKGKSLAEIADYLRGQGVRITKGGIPNG